MPVAPAAVDTDVALMVRSLTIDDLDLVYQDLFTSVGRCFTFLQEGAAAYEVAEVHKPPRLIAHFSLFFKQKTAYEVAEVHKPPRLIAHFSLAQTSGSRMPRAYGSSAALTHSSHQVLTGLPVILILRWLRENSSF